MATRSGTRQSAEERREEVLVAATHEFAQRGYHAASTAAIAERAGISPRSLFRYFDDIDDLNRSAVERQIDAHRALFELDIDPDAPTANKIVS